MNRNEILSFLLPQFDDKLQLTFFAIILLMIGYTVVSAHRTARAASWEHKWNRGTPDDPTDDLDIEHGSVTDLWHAVATGPEKLAEIMPGMLLVVGLLGTFIGLGLALNHASSILSQANLMSAGAAADSMQNLLGLLQGLGTKFKTSTWGILGFVLLKIWSEVTRFEEKRLAWVIGKVKTELEKRKLAQARTEEARQEALFSTIGRAATGIVQGMAGQFAALVKSNEAMHLQTLQHLHKLDTSVNDASASVVAGMAQQFEASIKNDEQANRRTLRQLAKLEEGIVAVRTDIVEGMSQEFAAAIKHDENLHLKTLQQLRKLEQGTEGVRADLEMVHAEAQATSGAMVKFTDGTQRIVKGMANAAQEMATAAQGMADGADKVGSGANELVEAVGRFEHQFTEVLDKVGVDLGKAIQDMNAQASATLERGSAQLSNATSQISTALDKMSADTKTTMEVVTSSIQESIQVQRDAAGRFKVSSDTLNTNILATTGIVDAMTKSIAEDLEAISIANRQMKKVGDAVEKSSDNMGKLVAGLQALPTNLEPLRGLVTEQKSLVSALKPLPDIVEVQRATLALLQAMQAEKRSSRAPGDTASALT